MKSQILSNIKKGKKLKETVPEYLEEMRLLYEKYGTLQFIFAYYDYCEDKIEKEFTLSDEMKGLMEELEKFIQSYLDKKIEIEEARDTFFDLRKKSTTKMEEMMGFVTRIELFEHVINHMQYKFDPPYEGEYNRENIAQRLYEYIFNEKDNVIIDGKIKCLLEQFPAPLVKSKFYDFILQNIGLYIGADKESMERMVDTIRSTGCLKKIESRDEKQLIDIIAELENKDYRSMEQAEFEDTKQFVSNIAKQLASKVDSLCLYQKVLNYFGALLLCGTDLSIQEEYKLIQLLVESSEEREKLRQAEALFYTLEGRQEDLFYEIDMAASYLEELPQIEKKGQKGLKETEMEEKRVDLVMAGKLLSDNLFSPLNQMSDEIVTEEEAMAQAGELIEEFKVFFKAHNRAVNQSVMARILSILPIVYKTQREIAEYIEYAIIQSRSKEQVMANFELYQLVQGKF